LLGVRPNGQQDEFPLHGVPRVEFGDLDHVDELVELLDHLLKRRRLHVDHDGQTGEALVLGGCHGEGEDVVATSSEQAGHTGEHPGAVLDQHRENVVLRGRSGWRRQVHCAPPG